MSRNTGTSLGEKNEYSFIHNNLQSLFLLLKHLTRKPEWLPLNSWIRKYLIEDFLILFSVILNPVYVKLTLTFDFCTLKQVW